MRIKSLGKKLLSFIIVFSIVMSIPVLSYAQTRQCDYIYLAFQNFPTVQSGASGDKVRSVQRFFTCLSGYARTEILSSGGIDGVYGATSQRLVREFQSAQGIAVTGTVNSTTWDKICFYTYDTDGYGNPDGYVAANHYCESTYVGSHILYYNFVDHWYYTFCACDIDGNRVGSSFYSFFLY